MTAQIINLNPTTNTRKTSNTARPKVGDIYYSSWGYEQTNIDYYEVIRVTRVMVVLQPIAQKTSPMDRHMSTLVEPVPGHYIGKPFRRRVGEGGWVRITSCENAYPWDGAAKRATHYA